MTGFPRQCPVFDFRPRARHRNPERLDPEPYGIRVPGGLASSDVRRPSFVSAERIVSLLRQRRRTGSRLEVVPALTRSEFSLRFPDPDRQWDRDNVGWADPAWVFRGGDVLLEVSIEVFVARGYRPRDDDPVGQELFGVIMQHELEHVADAVDMVSRWLPPRVYGDAVVRRYLGDGQPLTERAYAHWIREGNLEHRILADLWAPEHNRRQARLDSPESYAPVQERIDELQRRGINR